MGVSIKQRANLATTLPPLWPGWRQKACGGQSVALVLIYDSAPAPSPRNATRPEAGGLHAGFFKRNYRVTTINEMMPMNSGALLMTEIDDERLATLAKALGHPARLKILMLLARTPGCIGGDIVQAVGLAQSTVSEHLRILKSAGVIEGQIDPPRVCYALAPGALAPLAAMIAALEAASTDPSFCVTPAHS